MASIVVIGDVYTLQGRRKEVVELLRETQERVRPEAGCVTYSFAEVVGDDGHYVVAEEWRDEAALQAHYEGEAFLDYRRGIEALLARPSDVRIHRVSETERPAPRGPMDPRRAD
jgi:quinol monooxygenase YgiN